ncbi:MAG: NADH:ubiquinone reductase (Na(+)-transporting) subunit F, partial [Halioglobus sp.]|nr:NADH:ubiquinone reductase (Na(+)-transporting) subunit F [Halioglobus sp.]
MAEIAIIVGLLTAMVLLLSSMVLLARHWLAPSGTAEIALNGQRTLRVTEGQKLLGVLAYNDVLLPAACGGRGSCGQCRVIVVDGGGEILPTERSLISRREAANGARLACMVTVRGKLSVRVPDELLEARRLQGRVRSNHNVSTYMKELVLELPEDGGFAHEAGDYVLVEAPPGKTHFSMFAIPAAYIETWRRDDLFDLAVERNIAEQRAYSIANAPQEQGIIRLVVRIALPPASAAAGTPPGLVSSYLFGLSTGDTVTLSGPFGKFHARESDAEMVLIGGGAGIAPLRAILNDQLLGRDGKRRISLWYGARDKNDICFADEFGRLTKQHDNFSWHVALSDRNADPDWSGSR